METDTPPFDYSFSPSDIENLQAQNQIQVIAYDTAFNKGEATATFNVQQ